MAKPSGPVVSPYVVRFADSQDRVLSISVAFDDVTRLLGTTTIFRDVGCEYAKLLIGLGTDGTPESTTHGFRVPAGTTNVSAAQLVANGLSVIEDVLGLQITIVP